MANRSDEYSILVIKMSAHLHIHIVPDKDTEMDVINYLKSDTWSSMNPIAEINKNIDVNDISLANWSRLYKELFYNDKWILSENFYSSKTEEELDAIEWPLPSREIFVWCDDIKVQEETPNIFLCDSLHFRKLQDDNCRYITGIEHILYPYEYDRKPELLSNEVAFKLSNLCETVEQSIKVWNFLLENIGKKCFCIFW